MENNESNPKPQQTGGLKIMTIFIVVLAAHVVVIGGFSIHALMSGGGSDADLVTDKTHKEVKVTPDSATVSDGQLPDSISNDKSSADASTSTPMTIPAPPAASASTPAPTSAPESTATATPSATPTVPAPTPAPAPAPAPAMTTTEPTSSSPSGPIPSGPVITPPASSAPATDLASEPAAEPSSAPEAKPVNSISYTVKAHDSLARIAHRHHVKVAAIRTANGLKSDILQIGEKLILPAAKPESSSGLAVLREPNTTLLGDSDPAMFKAAAGTSHDKASIASDSGSSHTYTVAKGDTLTKIARKFHTSSTAIMALNNISDARKLKLGQKLKIPSQESRSATSTPPPRAQPVDRIEPRATPSAQLANFVP